MGKRKKQRKTCNNAPAPVMITMSADELKNVIISAIATAEQNRAENLVSEEKAREEIKLKEWRAEIGYKEPFAKSAIGKFCLKIAYIIRMIIGLPFIKESKIEGDNGISIVVSFFSGLPFSVIQFGIPVLFFLLWISLEQVYDFSLLVSIILFIAFLLGAFLFVGIFRIAKIEVSKMKDQTMRLTLFTAATSVISIGLAILSLLKG